MPHATIGKIDAPRGLDLVVRIGPEIESGCELNPPRRLDEDLIASQKIANEMRLVIRSILRKEERAAFDEAALRNRLRRDEPIRQHQRTRDKHNPADEGSTT